MYINVENVNDNVPMTAKPVYYPTIAEGSLPGTKIIKLDATDEDNDNNVLISYKITSGNPEGFFDITPTGRRQCNVLYIDIHLYTYKIFKKIYI